MKRNQKRSSIENGNKRKQTKTKNKVDMRKQSNVLQNPKNRTQRIKTKKKTLDGINRFVITIDCFRQTYFLMIAGMILVLINIEFYIFKGLRKATRLDLQGNVLSQHLKLVISVHNFSSILMRFTFHMTFSIIF